MNATMSVNYKGQLYSYSISGTMTKMAFVLNSSPKGHKKPPEVLEQFQVVKGKNGKYAFAQLLQDGFRMSVIDLLKKMEPKH